MWWVSLLLFQNAQPSSSAQAERARAQMADSLARQQAAAQQQLQAVAPQKDHPQWRLPALPLYAPTFDCDPVPEPDLGKMITRAAQDHQVNPAIIREVARQESAFHPCAVSPAGAIGLMQLMPSTQVQFAVRNPLDAQESLTAGTKLLKQLLDRYHGDIGLALAAYNAGSAEVDRTSAIPLIPETQNYVSTILQRLKDAEPPTVPGDPPN
jgi:soluble lytic murein transglycosylase-like protein